MVITPKFRTSDESDCETAIIACRVAQCAHLCYIRWEILMTFNLSSFSRQRESTERVDVPVSDSDQPLNRDESV